MYIEAEGFSEAYHKLCCYVINNGIDSSPRGMETNEIIGGIVRVKNPRTRIINNLERKLSIPFAIGEWLWCMQGRDDLEMIQYYAPSYGQYSDNGKTLNGAYGPRILPNLKKIIGLLQSDKYSRRAVVPIYKEHDVGLNSRDIPCTLDFQFLVRENCLHMIVNMRSNDIFLGFPYDIFNFSMFQEYISTILHLELGEYVHMVGSFHYYKKNKEKLLKMIECCYKEELMESMSAFELENQLEKMYTIERCIRNNQKYDSMLNSYFKFFEEKLLAYHKLKSKRGML